MWRLFVRRTSPGYILLPRDVCRFGILDEYLLTPLQIYVSPETSDPT